MGDVAPHPRDQLGVSDVAQKWFRAWGRGLALQRSSKQGGILNRLAAAWRWACRWRAARPWQTLHMSAPHRPALPPALPPELADRLQPLASLAPARLAALHGVLTDIDDTLTDNGAIQPAALAALQQLQAAGVPVIAITGRPVGWSLPFARAWPLAAIVAENGAVLLRRLGQAAGPGALLQQDFVADAASRAANTLRLQACARAVLAAVRAARLAEDSAGRLTDIAVDHSEFHTLDAQQITQVLVVMRAHGLTASVSSIHINGWIGEHDKYSGAAWAVAALFGQPFKPAQWLYLGDSTNDQVMFERLPLSVGVANIARFVPQLRWLPGYVTRAERGDGFAELATALLAARASMGMAAGVAAGVAGRASPGR